MKLLWGRLAARINAMTMRERFLLFACVIAILGAITQAFFISPLISQQKVLVAEIDKKSSEMDLRRDETNLEILKRNRDQIIELNSNTLKVQSDLASVERDIAALSTTGADAGAISTMLKRVLRRSDKVTLVRVVQVGTDLSAIVPAGTQAAARSGLDITLAGSYLDLMDYLALLEKELPQSRWGTVVLKAETVPVQVTVRLFSTAVES